MSRAAVELDFFGMEKDGATVKSHFQKFLDRRRSFRGMQSAISKIDPELLKTVISSGSASQAAKNNPPFASAKWSFSVPSTQKADQKRLPALPVYAPAFRPATGTTPITIFYNGTVSVFAVSPEQAETIMKLALEENSKNGEPADSKVAFPQKEEDRQLLETLNGDLPLARRKSLHRFLEKRKERLTSACPYAAGSIQYAVSDQKKSREELFRGA